MIGSQWYLLPIHRGQTRVTRKWGVRLQETSCQLARPLHCVVMLAPVYLSLTGCSCCLYSFRGLARVVL